MEAKDQKVTEGLEEALGHLARQAIKAKPVLLAKEETEEEMAPKEILGAKVLKVLKGDVARRVPRETKAIRDMLVKMVLLALLDVLDKMVQLASKARKVTRALLAQMD